jgi:hypothetical protein
MRVLLATAADQPWSRKLLSLVEGVARSDRFGEHVLATDAREADLILFVDPHQHPSDWRQRALRRHTLVRAFPEKVLVYDERDVPRDALPGLYVSMPSSSFDERRHRAFGYYKLLNDTRNLSDQKPDLLFSFRGRRVGAVRDDVLGLSHARAVLEDTTAHDFFGEEDESLSDARSRYRELVGRSKFVLCPRGAGTASLRLFEALACGRVPVVLSDEWVPPDGIDWQACSVRIRERDARSIPRRLEELEADWPALSAAAAETYRDWFASDVWFHRAIEHCRELKETGCLGLAAQWRDRAVWRDGARRWKSAVL